MQQVHQVGEALAGLVVISVALTPLLRDWGTPVGPVGTPQKPAARWLAPRLGPCPRLLY
jgi:hypothetical protein